MEGIIIFSSFRRIDITREIEEKYCERKLGARTSFFLSLSLSLFTSLFRAKRWSLGNQCHFVYRRALSRFSLVVCLCVARMDWINMQLLFRSALRIMAMHRVYIYDACNWNYTWSHYYKYSDLIQVARNNFRSRLSSVTDNCIRLKKNSCFYIKHFYGNPIIFLRTPCIYIMIIPLGSMVRYHCRKS